LHGPHTKRNEQNEPADSSKNARNASARSNNQESLGHQRKPGPRFSHAQPPLTATSQESPR
jgi:hypothetical protein